MIIGIITLWRPFKKSYFNFTVVFKGLDVIIIIIKVA